MENRFEAVLGADFEILFDGSVREVECRTSSCWLSIAVDPDHKDMAYEYLQVMPLGNKISPSLRTDEDGDAIIEAHVLIARDNREMAAHRDWYMEFRVIMLDRMEEQK